MNGSCLCGRITIRVPGRPDYLNACNCTFCTKLGAVWGYFPLSRVEFAGEPRAYVRADIADPALSGNFCPDCGATTHWAPHGPGRPDRAGINMRLFDPAELIGIELRFGDRRNHAGVEPRHHYREPTIFDGAGATA
ncbi:MAG: glutathione-dependent formaldehyde-activating protein [Sphingomonas bacterium]|nr:aldehyde-activating protein [Sphingomonas bacterium]MDB5688702.1 glutathione-dependent formaldehyde-activating protein [Sphingomonas bacterium]